MKKLILIALLFPVLAQAESGFIFGTSSTTTEGMFSDKNPLDITFTGNFPIPAYFHIMKCMNLEQPYSPSGVYFSTESIGLDSMIYNEYGSHAEGLQTLSFNNVECLNTIGTNGQSMTLSLTENFTSISFPALKTSNGFINLTAKNLTSVSLPVMETGGLSLNAPSLITWSLPELKYGYNIGNVNTGTLNSLSSISIPKMVSANSISFNDLKSLASITIPELVSVGGGFVVFNSTGVISISFPKLSIVDGGFSINNNNNVSYFNFSELTKIGGQFLYTGGSPGNFNFNGIYSFLPSFSFPKLTTVYGAWAMGTVYSTSVYIPNLSFVGGTMSLGFGTVFTLSLPSLASIGTLGTGVGNSLTITGSTSAVILDLPNLAYINGGISMTTLPRLSTMTLTSLSTVTAATAMSFSSLQMVNLPSLISASTFTISASSNVITVSMPSIVTIGSATFSGTNGNITNFTFGTTGVTKNVRGNITISNQKLTQASVDQILNMVASLDGTNGTVSWGTGRVLSLQGGTNSTPSAAGLIDKATIQARGATVLTN